MIDACVSKSMEFRRSIGTFLFWGGLPTGAPTMTVSLFLLSKGGGDNVEGPAFCCVHSNVRLDMLGVLDVVNDLNLELSLSADC